MAQYTAITLREKQDPIAKAQRSNANKVFQWVLPWWHNAWGFIEGQQRPWYEKAAAILVPSQYTGYRVAKQSGRGLSFPEGLAMFISPIQGLGSDVMVAAQTSRPDVGFPANTKPVAWSVSQTQWTTPVLPPVWRQNLNAPPVVLRQTQVWAYRPLSRPTTPVFTQLIPKG